MRGGEIQLLNAVEIQLARELGMLEYASKAAQPLTSAIADAGGGLANELATEFIKLTVDESVLLSMVRTEIRSAPAGELSKIDVGGNVSRAGVENTAGTETRRPTFNKLTYSVKKVETLFDITGEFETGNIEGSGGAQTVRDVMMDATMNDWETLLIEGDISNGGATDFDKLVQANDGVNSLATLANGAHVFDAGNKRISRALIKQALKQMPTKYRRDTSSLRLFVSSDIAMDMADEGATRVTDRGDNIYFSEGASSIAEQIGPFGIRVVPVPLMPQDLTLSGTDSQGSVAWLCDPMNIRVVIHRQLTAESERKAREDRTEVTVRTATDYLIENTNAFVKIANLLVDFAGSRYT